MTAVCCCTQVPVRAVCCCTQVPVHAVLSWALQAVVSLTFMSQLPTAQLQPVPLKEGVSDQAAVLPFLCCNTRCLHCYQTVGILS